MKLSDNGRDKLCRYIPIPAPDRRSESGFTFVELMIALVLSLIIMVPLFNLLIDQQKTYTVQSQMTNMRQNARIGLDIMTKELRMAGYGIPASTWDVSPTPQPKIAQTPNATSITFYCNVEGVKTVLAADEAAAETVLSVEFITDFEVGNTVYIEGPDDAPLPTTHWHSSSISAIDGSSSPKTITILSGLNFKYLKGSTIHKRDTITYTFSSANITRTRNTDSAVLAYEIQNMTLNYTFEDNGAGLPNDGDQATDTTNDTDDIRMINISITAQTKNKDPFLNTNRTTTFTSDVTPVNITY